MAKRRGKALVKLQKYADKAREAYREHDVAIRWLHAVAAKSQRHLDAQLAVQRELQEAGVCVCVCVCASVRTRVRA